MKHLGYASATEAVAERHYVEGEERVTNVAVDPTFRYDPALFFDAPPDHEPTTLPPGPNGPVGTRWIGLSRAHLGVHGTAEPGEIGRAQTHGCVRLTNRDAAELAALVRPGTPVALEN